MPIIIVYPLKAEGRKDFMITLTVVSRASLIGTVGISKTDIICRSCNGEAQHDYFVRIDGINGHAMEGRGRYIGLSCFLPFAYHSDIEYINVNHDGHDNTTEHRIPNVSIEFEMYSRRFGSDFLSALGFSNVEYIRDENGRRMPYKADVTNNADEYDMAFREAYCRLMFVGYSKTKRTNHVELDCTVTAEGHVWFMSLEGASKYLHNLSDEELKCFDNPNCGAHMHVSCDYARREWCGRKIFKPILEKIEAMTPEKRIEIFGSDFRHYAYDDVGGHGCAINYRTAHNTIELRLTRIHNVDNYIRVCKWFRDVVSVINRNGALIDNGITTAEKIGRKCANKNVMADKYSKGR